MINLMVVFGGQSCEHDISIITGLQLINNCNKYIYNVIPVYIDKNGYWLTGEDVLDLDNYPNSLRKLKECCIIPNSDYLYIKKGNKLKKFCKVDCSILCLHGVRGEDGVVAGCLELSKIPYGESSICCSSVCMDKVVFKYAMKGMGVKVVEGHGVSKDNFEKNNDIVYDVVEKLGFPVILKPSRQGSSIGIYVCKEKENLIDCMEKSFQFDDKVLIERYIHIKKEVNIALFKCKGEIIYSQTEEPIKYGDILSFDEKYKKSGGNFEKIKRVIPADVSSEQFAKIKEISTIVYNELGAVGVIRFDFLIDNDDNVYLNEVNTIPGSMANYLFKNESLDYSDLINMLVKNAVLIKRYVDIDVVDSGVLKEGIVGIKK